MGVEQLDPFLELLPEKPPNFNLMSGPVVDSRLLPPPPPTVPTAAAVEVAAAAVTRDDSLKELF